MNVRQVQKLLKDTDFVHESGTPEELKVAELLKAQSEATGAQVHLEPFDVEMTTIRSAGLTADGTEYPCKGYRLCGSGTVEAPFLYLSSEDPLAMSKVPGKIVLVDAALTHFFYQDLVEKGAVGFITYTGSVLNRDRDIDQKELRSYVSLGKKMLGVSMNAKDAAALVRRAPETVRISVDQEEYPGQSHNVVAILPGQTEEFITLSAHYDTTFLSHGSYDNMSGCIALLAIMEAMAKGAPHRYGLRFVFCGSEERGLLGSKAYAAAHEEELKKCVLNINLDMVGSRMGKFFACVSAEEALVSYLKYLGMELGWSIEARTGVYSSDSTPFADKGVPALSFARQSPRNQASIHDRYDTIELLSPEQILKDADFITTFTRRMADAALCPVSRTIPDKVKNELDEYLNRKRKG